MLGNKKAAPIVILKVLQEYSDENNVLTQQDIIQHIQKDYHISLQRKSIGDNITLLEELGYDIVRRPKNGCYLGTRYNFDEAEIKYLIDAIFSTKNLSSNQAQKLSEKISFFLSKNQRKKYNYLYKSSDLNRSNNATFFYTIDKISQAIESNQDISFQYAGYDSSGKEILRAGGYQYHVSPYYLVNNFGRYYLLCHYINSQTLSTFRVDFIRNAAILDSERVPITTIQPNFNISEYINDHIYIFSDTVSNCKIKINHESVITAIKDWFGKNAKITYTNDQIYADIRCDESAFYFWALQYGENIQVLEPSSLVIKLSRTYKHMYERYKDYLILNDVKPDLYQDLMTFLHHQLYKYEDEIKTAKEISSYLVSFLEESLTSNYLITVEPNNRILIENKKDNSDRYLVSVLYLNDKETETAMFNALVDLRELEDEKRLVGGDIFQLVLTRQESYYSGNARTQIKEIFRKTRHIPNKETIMHPSKEDSVTFNNSYNITWRAITNLSNNRPKLKYYVLKVKS